MDLRRVLRERLRQAFESESVPEGDRQPRSVPLDTSVDPGQVTSVYCDARVTIIHRTGENPIIRLDDRNAEFSGASRRSGSAPVVPEGQKGQR